MRRIDEETEDAIDITGHLSDAGIGPGPRLFAACLRIAGMGAVSMGQGWWMSREEFTRRAGDAYDWAVSRRK